MAGMALRGLLRWSRARFALLSQRCGLGPDSPRHDSPGLSWGPGAAEWQCGQPVGHQGLGGW